MRCEVSSLSVWSPLAPSAGARAHTTRKDPSSGRMASATGPQVVVIGAGIIGSSIACHLAARGARVNVLEAASGPAQGASGKSWAWLNANRKEPQEYKALSVQSMQEWRQLPDLAEFPGTLYLGDKRDGDSRYPSERLSREQTLQEQPGISGRLADDGAVLYRQEGFAYLPKATETFLAQACEQGAKVHYNSEVQSLERGPSEHVASVATAQHTFPADFVVLAAGLGAPALAEPLGAVVPLTHKPGTVNILTPPCKRLLNRILVTDEAFLMQRGDGRILISFYKGVHSHTDASDVPEEPSSKAFPQIASQAMQQACQLFPPLAEIPGEPEVIVGRYPYPKDAHPLLGFLEAAPNVYCSVMHSGATLGPIVGKLAAEEILTGTKLPILAPFRPERDFSDLSHLY